MLTIKKTTVQTECETATANAKYLINYDVENSAVIRVTAQVVSADSDKHIGTLVMANDSISASLPIEAVSSAYLADFVILVNEVKSHEKQTPPADDPAL